MFSLCWYRLTLTLTKLRRFQPRHKIEEVHVLADQRSDRLTELEDQYAGYEVYDHDGEKIGSVHDLFVDENDDLKYIGVKIHRRKDRSLSNEAYPNTYGRCPS